MENKTALQWFIDQLPIRIVNSYREEIAKALNKEKEQINKAYYDGYYQEELYDAREYYNDTYTNNNKQ